MMVPPVNWANWVRFSTTSVNNNSIGQMRVHMQLRNISQTLSQTGTVEATPSTLTTTPSGPAYVIRFDGQGDLISVRTKTFTIPSRGIATLDFRVNYVTPGSPVILPDLNLNLLGTLSYLVRVNERQGAVVGTVWNDWTLRNAPFDAGYMIHTPWAHMAAYPRSVTVNIPINGGRPF